MDTYWDFHISISDNTYNNPHTIIYNPHILMENQLKITMFNGATYDVHGKSS